MSQEDVSNAQKRGIRWGWIILGLIVIVVSAGLFVKGSEGNIHYYMTVSEYRARQAKYEGKKIKLAGKVALASLKKENDKYVFSVEDLGKQIQVTYVGLAPDTFKEGVDVVVEGRGQLGDEFVAESLMAKCASKYEAGGLPPLEKMRGKSVY